MKCNVVNTQWRNWTWIFMFPFENRLLIGVIQLRIILRFQKTWKPSHVCCTHWMFCFFNAIFFIRSQKSHALKKLLGILLKINKTKYRQLTFISCKAVELKLVDTSVDSTKYAFRGVTKRVENVGCGKKYDFFENFFILSYFFCFVNDLFTKWFLF